MRTLVASALLILGATLTVAQKQSDKQIYDVIGQVKVVREIRVYFDYQGGKYSESPTREPERSVKVFDREGTLLFSEVLTSTPACGFRVDPYFDPSKRVYDSIGNLVEYMPGDTLAHSGYRLKHIYDSKRRLVETEHYDPYTLRYKWLYAYEKDDEQGNWTYRTVTPITINAHSDKLSKSEVYRFITYY